MAEYAIPNDPAAIVAWADVLKAAHALAGGRSTGTLLAAVEAFGAACAQSPAPPAASAPPEGDKID